MPRIFLLFFMLFCSLSLACYLDGQTAPSFCAYADLDALSGTQQSFTVDNRFDRFADEFRTEQVAAPFNKSAVSSTEKRDDLNLWRYHRSVNYGALYTSNNTWAESKDDVVHTLNPTVGLSRRSDYTYVALFYDLTAAQHVEQEESNTVNHAQRTLLAYNFPRLKITFSNTYRPSSAYAIGTRTELQPDEGSVAGSGGRVSVFTNNFAMNASYAHSKKTLFAVSYSHNTFYFPSPDNSLTASQGNTGFSNMAHRVTPKVSYAWTPKTQVFAQYTFGADDYYRGGRFSSLSHEPRVGVVGKLTDRTGYTASAGYHFRNYEDRSFRDWDNPTVDLGLFRKLTPKIDASLTYTLAPQERLSAVGDQELFAVTHFGGLSLNWQATQKIKLGGFGKMGFTAQDGHLTKPDIENPAVSYTRPDETVSYDFGLSADWNPRRFVTLSLAYDYTNLNATFKDSEADTHRLGGRVGLIF